MREELEHFTVTEKHIKLLRAAQVSWCGDEFGAPAIDPRRPYGNSNVYGDMLYILHGERAGDNDTYGELLLEQFNTLHQQTKIALQIFLATGVMEPGEYVTTRYTTRWRRNI
jgi:hypothetical protein